MEGNIKQNPRVIGCEGVNWPELWFTRCEKKIFGSYFFCRITAFTRYSEPSPSNGSFYNSIQWTQSSYQSWEHLQKSTQPPARWVPASPSLGIKLTTYNHLVPRARMRVGIPPLPQYVFISWCLVKHRDNFTFIFYLRFEFDQCSLQKNKRYNIRTYQRRVYNEWMLRQRYLFLSFITAVPYGDRLM
jgi:hypothetical protein